MSLVEQKFREWLQAFKAGFKAGEEQGLPSRDDNGIWVIMFADQDRPPEVFMNAGADEAASKRFESLSAAWTCMLFRCVAETGYGPKT